jgi:hypothetical protein
MTVWHIILIYLGLGIYPAYKIAGNHFDQYKKTYTPSLHEVRFKWLAKTLDSVIFGFSFIIALVLWLPQIIENIIIKTIVRGKRK